MVLFDMVFSKKYVKYQDRLASRINETSLSVEPSLHEQSFFPLPLRLMTLTATSRWV